MVLRGVSGRVKTVESANLVAGTPLPALATSVTATIKGEHDIAVDVPVMRLVRRSAFLPSSPAATAATHNPWSSPALFQHGLSTILVADDHDVRVPGSGRLPT